MKSYVLLSEGEKVKYCSSLPSHQILFELKSNDSKYISRVMCYSVSIQALQTISASPAKLR